MRRALPPYAISSIRQMRSNVASSSQRLLEIVNAQSANVRAFGTAVDQAFAKFYGDLAALTKDTHAG